MSREKAAKAFARALQREIKGTALSKASKRARDFFIKKGILISERKDKLK